MHRYVIRERSRGHRWSRLNSGLIAIWSNLGTSMHSDSKEVNCARSGGQKRSSPRYELRNVELVDIGIGLGSSSLGYWPGKDCSSEETCCGSEGLTHRILSDCD
jgi:hypothetical protein